MSGKLVFATFFIMSLIGMIGLSFEVHGVEASVTVYIQTDGSIYPSDAPMRRDGDTYTMTGDIVDVLDGIVIYRSNVVLEGGGHVLQGTSGPYLSGILWQGVGVILQGVNNITIRNLEIELFNHGVFLEGTFGTSICGNNLMNNNRGIELYGCLEENYVFGNSLTTDSEFLGTLSTDAGIGLSESSNSWIFENTIIECTINMRNSTSNKICENNITNGTIMVDLGSNSNEISENRLTNGTIAVYSSNSNSICRNKVTHDKADCIVLDYASLDNDILENNITAGGFGHTGISLSGFSSYNRIIGNNITNGQTGIMFSYSTNNTVYGNNLIGNNYEFSFLYESVNNIICNNNFINNTNQIWNYGYPQIWDRGYPCGGNYWSNYAGTDTDGDGIGDSPHIVDADNTDNHPLMGMFNNYNVTYYTSPNVLHACNVTVISNSTISDFVAPIWIEHPEFIFLQFNVTGMEGSTGFCRVSFATAMMNGTYHVSLNGSEIPYTLLPCSDANTSYLYFNYTHSIQEVMIIPEFPSFLILPLFSMVTLLAAILYKGKRR